MESLAEAFESNSVSSSHILYNSLHLPIDTKYHQTSI